jgi:hypothetical protein
MSGLTSYRQHFKVLKPIGNRDVKKARRQNIEHVQAGQPAVLEQINRPEAIHGRWGSMKAKQLALGPSIGAARSACRHLRVFGNAANNDP